MVCRGNCMFSISEQPDLCTLKILLSLIYPATRCHNVGSKRGFFGFGSSDICKLCFLTYSPELQNIVRYVFYVYH